MYVDVLTWMLWPGGEAVAAILVVALLLACVYKAIERRGTTCGRCGRDFRECGNGHENCEACGRRL